jgi:hypothetical protein
VLKVHLPKSDKAKPKAVEVTVASVRVVRGRRGSLLGCDWAELGAARLTRGLARKGERKNPSVSTLGTNVPAVESPQGRQKHMIAARFYRPFGTWLAFGLESQR